MASGLTTVIRAGMAVTAGALVGVLLAGCGSTGAPTVIATASSTGQATDSSTVQPAIAGTFDIGGDRSMYLECAGFGSPTVILIGGLRAAADYWNRADQAEQTVFASVAERTRACSYDRPGTVRAGNEFSRSDPIAQPSSEEQAAIDLHSLLTAADVDGPYLLAAHSYGGFIARLYTSNYPDLVDGLVLIDALSEGFQDALTPEQSAEWEASAAVPAEDIEIYPGIERLDMPEVLAQIRRAAPIRDLPLTVLSADKRYAALWESMIQSGEIPVGTPANLGAAIDSAQAASQNYQASLTPDAVHITQTNSGHDIPLENPAVVSGAILAMLDGLMGSR